MSRSQNLTETLLLFTALLLLVPAVPTSQLEGVAFGVYHYVSIACFAVSRAIRWQRQWYFAALEAAAYVLIVVILHRSDELLLAV
ncbi:hypothetical protein HME9302_00733 [Alteripontixanthobacter maritimus]|uniref:Uncharacterized protein n=1 Tax=Alteripontixanthobacter maritimus TaxID=2161824 RepID=A0A369Q3T1_9SPHN|nr:hypothetical protein [Alteripontixanthobacter maritimus]RDC59543.1 hypothetical protein HME9302_00733 [Alteripontixanthobacter maritimus]